MDLLVVIILVIQQTCIAKKLIKELNMNITEVIKALGGLKRWDFIKENEENVFSSCRHGKYVLWSEIEFILNAIEKAEICYNLEKDRVDSILSTSIEVDRCTKICTNCGGHGSVDIQSGPYEQKCPVCLGSGQRNVNEF